jgi:hypothetical protein
VADKEDDLFDRVSDMADRLGLEGSERKRYVHGSMTRGGYKAVPQYVKADTDDDDDDDDDFFGGGRKRRRTRDSDSGRTRSRSRSRDDDEDGW